MSTNRQLDTLSCLHERIIRQLSQWLEEHPPASPHLEGLFRHAKSQCLAYMMKDQQAPIIPEATEFWCRITTQRTCPETRGKGAKISILISGPVVGYSISVDAADEQEARQIERDGNLAKLSNICQSLAATRESLASLSRLSQAVTDEKARLSKDPGQTIQDHTRLLQEYNDIKDIGQQLIGLIADNRGVPINSMYKDEEYGISADD